MTSETMCYPDPFIKPTPADEVADKLYGRYDTLTKTLEYMPDNAVIIEVGASRNTRGKLSDGWSSLAFGRHIKKHGGQLIIIDNNHEAIRFCKRLMDEHGLGDVAWYIEADVFASFKDIREWDNRGLEVPEKVDLMYFDGWDRQYIGPDGVKTEGHSMYTELWLATMLWFPEIGHVLIDDTHRPGKNFDGVKNHMVDSSPGITGKGEHLLPMLSPKHYTIEFFEMGQVLLKKNAAPNTETADKRTL